MKKILASVLAVMLSCGILVGCGNKDTDTGNGGAVGDTTGAQDTTVDTDIDSAADILVWQIGVLDGIVHEDEGQIDINIVYDSAATDQQGTFSDILNAMVVGTSDDVEGGIAYDMTMDFSVEWVVGQARVSFSMGDEVIFEAVRDDDKYYVDLAGMSSLITPFIEDDENSKEMFSKIRITEDDYNALLSAGAEAANGDTSTLMDLPTIIGDAFLNGLSGRAEFDGNDVVIRGITADDLSSIFTKVSIALSGETEDVDTSETDSAVEDEAVVSDDISIDYRMSYAIGEWLSQIHKFNCETETGDKVTVTVSVTNEPVEIDISKYEDAVTFEEIFGVSLSDMVSQADTGIGDSPLDSADETITWLGEE